MKTKLLIVGIIITTFIHSCTVDNSQDIISEETDASSIIGTWDLTSLRYSEAIDFNFDGEASEEFLDELPCFNIVLVFREDGTFGSMATDIEFDFTMNSMVDCLDSTTPTMGTWSLDGNTLITVSDGETIETPLNLEGDTLTLSGPLGIGDAAVDESVTATLVFDRQ